ncbi:hypothetical protein SAMD00019534_066320 [Acytostelium subglobosum LB1]|uniref:hypothetical protein n=1 Tax=Acytostelium subglobosum LB1 TaxID=1410327 RepID=UPI0006450DD1|nr:hypothetical protein SAMD00019534_066320 [Acytostelium subglobosum LB1]GAM23457.1 hypothetical protein SAMD00019534_066320 [Acytostelium subglobosum LB1]|eukprot:XP_012753906.1 hypothetical protein SAMD00019534_066320 [Acytostelium subglobosum LB1]
MNKNSLLLVILLFVTLVVNINGRCSSCKSLNEVCTPDVDFCRDNSFCVTGEDGTGECIAIPGNGGDCSKTKFCLDEYRCDDITKICVSQNYLGYGESCANNTQCSIGLTCTDGSCSSSLYPKCVMDVECRYNERCNYAGTCATPLVDGSACQYGGDCSLLSNCMNRVCVPYFSVSEGGDCYSDEICDTSQNLLCIGFICQNKNFYDKLKCNSTLDCGDVLNYRYCGCDSSVSPSIGRCHTIMDPKGLSKQDYYDYNQCLMDNKCPQVDSHIPASCSGGKCGFPFSKTYKSPCSSGSALFNKVNITFVIAILLTTAIL